MNKLIYFFLFAGIIYSKDINKGSVAFKFNYGHGKHSSDLTLEEDSFVRRNNIQGVQYASPLSDPVYYPMEYSYRNQYFTGELQYFLQSHLSVGISFQSSAIFQKINYPEKYASFELESKLLKQISFGPIVEQWFPLSDKFGASVSYNLLFSTGYLNRVAALADGQIIGSDLRQLIGDLGEEIEINGFGSIIGAQLIYNISSNLLLFTKAEFAFSRVNLLDDPVYYYMTSSDNQGVGLSLGIAIIG